MRQCLLEISGKTFRWQAVGRLEAEVGVSWACDDSIGSWFGQDVQRDAVWRFQGAIHCTMLFSYSSTDWLTMTLPGLL